MGKGHRTVWVNGYKAAKAGVPREKVPYNVRSVGGFKRNIPTGARGYARAWLSGWDAAAAGKSVEVIDCEYSQE